jgi:hypothetical protein
MRSCGRVVRGRIVAQTSAIILLPSIWNECPLMAQSRHVRLFPKCLLSGLKRTFEDGAPEGAPLSFFADLCAFSRANCKKARLRRFVLRL